MVKLIRNLLKGDAKSIVSRFLIRFLLCLIEFTPFFFDVNLLPFIWNVNIWWIEGDRDHSNKVYFNEGSDNGWGVISTFNLDIVKGSRLDNLSLCVL